VVATDTKQYYIVPGTDYAGNETFVIANEIVGKD